MVENLDHMLLGTCSFSAQGWERSFYPPGLEKAGLSRLHEGKFKSIEVDATFSRRPGREGPCVGGFGETPQDFVFACKVPQAITHESRLGRL